MNADGLDTFFVGLSKGEKNKAYMEHLLASFEGYQSSKELVLKSNVKKIIHLYLRSIIFKL